ncbi:hypothetical protein [Priestia megaterium]|uniref:hypothetical protein n=1 Tax=Priestia megaterium TaxID=1404 RepID=UPI0027304466|nr:hypothetical protein [Priestia megaterium]MDP1443088.1 hypothetical protein [Priestia megaterium]MDP1472246.1 hypothetical protein [Priestia megaterium]
MSFHTFVENVRDPYFRGEVNTTTDFAKMLDECSAEDLVKRAQQHVTNLLTAQRELFSIKMYAAIEEYLHNDIFLLLSLVADALHNMPQYLTNLNKEELKVELLRFYQLKELILNYISEFTENKNVKIVFEGL